MIDKNELKLLEEFAYGDLTEEEFFMRYPIDLENHKEYLLDQLDSVTKQKDGDNLDLLLDVMLELEMYEDYDFQSKYRDLIRENWHRMHESLLDSLDKSEINQDSFIYVLSQIYDYHADGVEDFMVPIWSKCLWNLYSIKSEKGIEVIKQFVNSEYSYLSDTANKLLSKLDNE